MLTPRAAALPPVRDRAAAFGERYVGVSHLHQQTNESRVQGSPYAKRIALCFRNILVGAGLNGIPYAAIFRMCDAEFTIQLRSRIEVA